MQYASEIARPTPEGSSNGLVSLAGQASVLLVWVQRLGAGAASVLGARDADVAVDDAFDRPLTAYARRVALRADAVLFAQFITAFLAVIQALGARGRVVAVNAALVLLLLGREERVYGPALSGCGLYLAREL